MTIEKAVTIFLKDNEDKHLQEQINDPVSFTPPTIQKFTGSGTYTTPAEEVLYLIRMVGGGGGGSGAGGKRKRRRKRNCQNR